MANFSSLDNKGKTRLGMNLMHMNIRSLNKHKNDLINLLTLNNFNPDLLALSETKLNESNCYTNTSLPGFNFEHIDSPTKAGGVGAYISTDVTYHVRHDLNFNLQGCENLWLELAPNKSKGLKNYIVGIIYKHSFCNTNNFISLLSNSLLAINESNKKYFVVGDFNVNLLNVNERSIQHYLNTLESIGCISLVNKPTRVTNHSSTLLDHLYTNAIKGEIDVGVLQVNLTDHFL